MAEQIIHKFFETQKEAKFFTESLDNAENISIIPVKGLGETVWKVVYTVPCTNCNLD